MIKRLKTWFTALSRGGKTGVIIGTLVAVGMVNAVTADTPPITTKTVTQTEEVAYEEIFEDDPTLEVGTSKIKTPGVKGSQEVTYEVTYEGDKEIKRVPKSSIEKSPPQKQTMLRGVLTYSEEMQVIGIPFATSNVNDSSMTKGQTAVRTEGAAGAKKITFKVTKVNGKETARAPLKEEVISQPTNKVVAVGTKLSPKTPAPAPRPSNCHPSYSPCIPTGGDLDCPDVGMRVSVIGPDSYRLDADNDGTGCDSY